MVGGGGLTSWGRRRGSIMGGSSARHEWAGDEESRFSHSVAPAWPSPVSRKERFSSLMLVWCLPRSADASVSWTAESPHTGGGGGDKGAMVVRITGTGNACSLE